MRKEEIVVLAHILTVMKEGAEKLERLEKERDLEQINNIKSEILGLQRKLKEMLKNDR